MLRTILDFDYVSSFNPACKFIVRIVIRLQVLSTGVISANKHMSAVQIRAKTLNKIHDRKQFTSMCTVSSFKTLQRMTAIRNYTLHE